MKWKIQRGWRPNSLLAGKIRGISPIQASAARRLWPKRLVSTGPYGPIPYASEQGVFCGLAGNFNRAIRQIFALIRESRTCPLFGSFGAVMSPIVPPDLQHPVLASAMRCRRARASSSATRGIAVRRSGYTQNAKSDHPTGGDSVNGGTPERGAYLWIPIRLGRAYGD